MWRKEKEVNYYYDVWENMVWHHLCSYGSGGVVWLFYLRMVAGLYNRYCKLGVVVGIGEVFVSTLFPTVFQFHHKCFEVENCIKEHVIENYGVVSFVETPLPRLRASSTRHRFQCACLSRMKNAHALLSYSVRCCTQCHWRRARRCLRYQDPKTLIESSSHSHEPPWLADGLGNGTAGSNLEVFAFGLDIRPLAILYYSYFYNSQTIFWPSHDQLKKVTSLSA